MFCPPRGAKTCISLWTNTSVRRWLYPLFQNQSPPFCSPLFSENYLNHQVRINKIVSKYTTNYKLPYFYGFPKALYLQSLFGQMVECSFTNLSLSRFESSCSHLTFAPASSKEFLDIQVTIECEFTLKRVCDLIGTYSLYIPPWLRKRFKFIVLRLLQIHL